MEFEGNLTLRQSHIKRLDYYLNYQLSTSVLCIIILLSATLQGILVLFLYLAALIFIPYLLFVLIKEKKYGWIAAFIIFVAAPFITSKIFITGAYASLADLVALGSFYLYCFLLKMITRDWVSAENAKNDLAHKRMLKKIRDEEFNSRYVK